MFESKKGCYCKLRKHSGVTDNSNLGATPIRFGQNRERVLLQMASIYCLM